MKKLIITIAFVLGMGAMTFAQNGIYDDGEIYEETGLFGRGEGIFNRDVQPLFPEHEETDDFDANQTPLGSGIAVLVSLGAAYAVARKRREE
ncbi:MAG: hypothetical protein J6T22_10805 [Bacteroidales bacterium]|nr:hypothetical protein [Bacteroidales bacterium]